jgi:hypothetical protein
VGVDGRCHPCHDLLLVWLFSFGSFLSFSHEPPPLSRCG